MNEAALRFSTVVMSFFAVFGRAIFERFGNLTFGHRAVQRPSATSANIGDG